MQFIVHGYDGDDEGALDRRLAAREAHLANAKALKEKGNLLFATALIDESGKMVGSVVVCDFETREALETEWLAEEPYVTGDVWRRVEVQRTQIAPIFMQKLQNGG